MRMSKNDMQLGGNGFKIDGQATHKKKSFQLKYLFSLKKNHC